MICAQGYSSAVPPEEIEEAFRTVFVPGRVGSGVSLAPMTTFKTGGIADWFLETSDSDEVATAINTCQRLGLPVTLLGGGSNVLVGGKGVRGLVIRLRFGEISMTQDGTVRAAGGVLLNGLVRWMVNKGLSGLERWAGTPGTVGGAIHGNAHFQGRLIGDQIRKIGLVGLTGTEIEVEVDSMGFDYDKSRLQDTGEVAVWADFEVSQGDSSRLRDAAIESLAYRKRTQPLSSRSAGCIFRNPDRKVVDLPAGCPSSAGALVDLAGLKGATIGKARISSVHANFIVADGLASPNDIRELIELCRQSVQTEFGVTLSDEIRYLGEF